MTRRSVMLLPFDRPRSGNRAVAPFLIKLGVLALAMFLYAANGLAASQATDCDSRGEKEMVDAVVTSSRLFLKCLDGDAALRSGRGSPNEVCQACRAAIRQNTAMAQLVADNWRFCQKSEKRAKWAKKKIISAMAPAWRIAKRTCR